MGPTDPRKEDRPGLTHLRKAALLSAGLLVALVIASCSDDGDGGGTSPRPTLAQGCAEVTALKDSLTTLLQVDVVNDGTDALKAAADEVGTDLDAAASAVSSELQPAVDRVKRAFDGLESALEGVSSGAGLGAAATAVGTSLAQLGTALTDLTTEVGQVC